MVQDIRSLTDVYNAILAGGGGGSTADVIALLDLLLSDAAADPANTNLRDLLHSLKNQIDLDTDFYTGGVNDSVLYDAPTSRRAIDALIELITLNTAMQADISTLLASVINIETYIQAIEAPTTLSLNEFATFAASASEVIPVAFTAIKLLQVVASNNTNRTMLVNNSSGALIIVPNLASVDITCMFGLTANTPFTDNINVVTQNGTNANGGFYLNFYYTTI